MQLADKMSYSPLGHQDCAWWPGVDKPQLHDRDGL